MYENLAQKARLGRVVALSVMEAQGAGGALRNGRNTANSKLVFLSRRHNSNTVQFSS